MLSLLRALPGRLARRLRVELEHRLFAHRGPRRIHIGRPHAGGVIDSLEIGDEGIVTVLGWASDERAFVDGLQLSGDGVGIPVTHVFRVPRADLATLGGRHPERLGLVAEFVLPQALSGRALTVAVGDEVLTNVKAPTFQPLHYAELFGNPGVWHREDVYGVGPPEPRVSREILELCTDLSGPVLDFGCGAGALLTRLRAHGLETVGLELDNPIMRRSMLPAAASYVTFYDGVMPSPFASGAFASVTCCEVLEHIPDYAGAIAEMARLTRQSLVVTVPDMSSVPRGMRHGVVPWHLLERSHVNFFTQASLAAVLAPHFPTVRFVRIGEVRCERLRFYTSLVAMCQK